jgi:hypothetical protein
MKLKFMSPAPVSSALRGSYQLRAYRGRLPRGFKFDRQEANAR